MASASRPVLLPGLLDPAAAWSGSSLLAAAEHPGRAACLAVGAGVAVPGAPCLVMEAGQDLAVTRLSTGVDGRWQAQHHAAGHLLLKPATSFEEAVFGALRLRGGMATADHCLTSAGLVHLYQAVSEVQGWTPGRPDSLTVRQAGVEASDEAAQQALVMFCALLGGLAGQLAGDLCAWGGVALGRSVVPALGDWFASSPFRARFEAQAGQDVRGVPTWVMPVLASP